MSEPRVLVVLPGPPLPEGSAPAKTNLGLLRGLQAHRLDVTALAARQHFQAAGTPPPDLPLTEVAVPAEPPGLRARFAAYVHPRTELARGVFYERVREAARGADVVHLEQVETAGCDAGIATPSLVHLHYLVRRDRALGLPWTGDFRDVLLWQRAERAAIGRHRYIVASSPVVAAAIREIAPRSRVIVAPLSLDPAYYRAAPLDGPPVAGIIGTAGWPPTRAAIERLATRVWPTVRRLAPDARLIVAGRGTDRIAGLAGIPGLEVAGSVDSAAQWLSELSLLLFPLERGSGMKVKVLEAFASGLPVVTTAAGSEGIDASEGAVVDEEDEGLARAAAQILLDPGERRERGAAARRAFDQRYAPEPATRPLVELYEEMAG